MDRFRALITRHQPVVTAWVNKRSRWIWAAVIASTGVAAALSNSASEASAQSPSIDSSISSSSVDTFIPSGFVLVPIEVVNYEALDSVLGSYGVVDLFAADTENNRKSRRVASRIKILRAPRNPSHFAVLAPTSEAPALVRNEGGFFVVIQNPQGGGTQFENTGRERRPVVRRTSRLKVETNDE